MTTYMIVSKVTLNQTFFMSANVYMFTPQRETSVTRKLMRGEWGSCKWGGWQKKRIKTFIPSSYVVLHYLQ